LWLEVLLRSDLENFLLGHVKAFHDWGGVSRTILYDNLKSASEQCCRWGKPISGVCPYWINRKAIQERSSSPGLRTPNCCARPTGTIGASLDILALQHFHQPPRTRSPSYNGATERYPRGAQEQSMTKSNEDRASRSREEKRAQFSQPGRRNKSTPILVGAFVALAGFAVYLVASSSGDRPASSTVTATAPSGIAERSTAVRVPLSDLEDGQAKFFDYTLAGNKSVRFFVLKSSDGVYRAAMDACDVCFHARKGYRQEGDDMVCNNCGQHFHSALVNEVHGGCNPVALPRSVDGDSLVIQTAELEKRSGYF
jgi:Membrane iron-sulfur containing protein FtrD-like